jgi:glyoxylase-like metal-dependent hydrolase (beta-lactamase superfamily II)
LQGAAVQTQNENVLEGSTMKRWVVLGILIAVGGLSLAVSGFQAPPARPAAVALAATKIEKVKDNLYVITGSGVANIEAFSGGNTAVFITDTGVIVVDTKLAGWGQTILDRIKTVTNKPVTTIINTHTHGDHTGSNEFFGTTVDSIVQENTKTNMAKMDEFKGDKARFLPKRTYKDKLTLGKGKDQIDLYYFGAGHTSGDSFVVFPALRTMHAGDMFAWKALPYIDVPNGGSAVVHPQTLAKAITTIKNVDTVITGHTPVLAWNDLKEYADFSQEFVAWARNEIKGGKTVDEAVSEYKLPDKYKGYVVSVNPQFGSVKANLQAVYDELKK